MPRRMPDGWKDSPRTLDEMTFDDDCLGLLQSTSPLSPYMISLNIPDSMVWGHCRLVCH